MLTSKMFEGRRKTEGRDIAFVPYFVLYMFQKQTLCKYKRKLFKFISSFIIFTFIFVFLYISGALIHNCGSFRVVLALVPLYKASTAYV